MDLQFSGQYIKDLSISSSDKFITKLWIYWLSSGIAIFLNFIHPVRVFFDYTTRKFVIYSSIYYLLISFS